MNVCTWSFKCPFNFLETRPFAIIVQVWPDSDGAEVAHLSELGSAAKLTKPVDWGFAGALLHLKV